MYVVPGVDLLGHGLASVLPCPRRVDAVQGRSEPRESTVTRDNEPGDLRQCRGLRTPERPEDELADRPLAQIGQRVLVDTHPRLSSN